MIKVVPVITEKSYRLASGDKKTARQFSFYIDKNLNKIQAKQVIEKLFNVNISAAQIVNIKSQVKTFKKIKGKTTNFKKIIVKLKAGQSIKSFEIEEIKDKDKDKDKDQKNTKKQ